MFRKYLAFLFAFSLTLAFSTALPAKTKIKGKSINKTARAAKYPALQNELLAMGVLRQVYTAQVTYHATVGNGRFGSGMQLRLAGLIDDAVFTGVKYGYVYTISEVPNPGHVRFIAKAIPHRYGKTAKRSFYIDSGCKLRGENKLGLPADANSPLLETCPPTLAYDNERKTLAAMRLLDDAQLRYRSSVGNGVFGTLTQLYSAGLISLTLASGHHAGNVVSVTLRLPNEFQPAFYHAQSVPIIYGETGFRSFYIDADGILRGADKNGQLANANDPPIED